MSYFRKPDETKVYFKDIAVAIEKLHPSLSGKHIFEQLKALGLWNDMQEGTTPVSLPYSFTDYLPEPEEET